MSEELPERLDAFFKHLEANPKPNFTQYQLTLDEMIRVFDYGDSWLPEQAGGSGRYSSSASACPRWTA
jgi:hypothetical protein